MNIELLKKLRQNYRLVQTSENDWIWEKKTPFVNEWHETQVGSHEYGYYHKSRDQAIIMFIKFIHEKYRNGNYKRKRIYTL